VSFDGERRQIGVRTQEPSWTAAVAGDRDAFAALTAPYRRELEVHCYRMLGSIEDAQDLVQETLLRAWRRRESFQGRSTLRAWLYGIATNASLDALEHRSRRLLPPSVAAPIDDPHAELPPASDLGWLEPYPDHLLDEIPDHGETLDEQIVARETIELAFLVAIQHLPPKQRAVLILRDVLGWSAREAAAAIGTTVIAANSALQRARETLSVHLPERRIDWERTELSEAEERSLLERYMEAWDRTDVAGLVALLSDDARFAMPPTPAWYEGRDAIGTFLSTVPMRSSAKRHLRVPTRANRQPAFAVFLVDKVGATPRPFAIEVFRIVDGLIAEIEVFLQPELVARFGVTAPE
jgi:RNA polymerase sigma-70 factor (ECF subfamily)